MVPAALVLLVLAAPPVEAERALAGELTRLHLARRSIFVKAGTPPREVEVRVDEGTEVWARGRRAGLLDLRPGDRVWAELAEGGRVHRGLLVRTTTPSSRRSSAR